MDKTALLWLLIGIGAGAVMFQTEISEAIYSVPPTPAYKTFEVGYNATLSNSTQNTTTALSYNDKLYIFSDGSILINITEYSP